MLVQVVQPMPMWMFSSEASVGAIAYLDPAWEDEALHSAETYVACLGERLRKAGLQVEIKAVRGKVASSIHAVAEETDTDLLVRSTHAVTGPARTVLGQRRRRSCANESPSGSAGSAAKRNPGRRARRLSRTGGGVRRVARCES
jgi:nucleotide-binding universal stress UspA family protein